MKIRCIKCNDLAIWYYSPSFEGKIDAKNYYCDGCVSRGCSCNIDFDTDTEHQDESGRFLPCCEYDFSETGYDDNKVLDDSDLYDTDFDET